MRKLIVFVAVSLLAGCGAGPGKGAQPPKFEPKDQTTCKVQKSHSNPLIVEWPSAERASLEARARQGVVVVRYDGCELELLTRCTAPGSYSYLPVSPKRDALHIRNEDELWASMPIGAAALEGKLRNGGQLGVNMTLVGTYQSERAEVKKDELEGICEGATHIIGGLSVGSFEFYSAANESTEGGASVAGMGGGAKSSSHQDVLATDGRPEACDASSSKDSEPPDGCSALLRIEVIPLSGKARAEQPVAATKAAAPPPAPTPVEAPDATVMRYLSAANRRDQSTQSSLSSPTCWGDECGRFARQAGSKFRAELVGPVKVKGTRAVAGVSIWCSNRSSQPMQPRSELPNRGPWLGFPMPLGGMEAAPMPPEDECDFVHLYLEHSAKGWMVMWIDEDESHATKFLDGTQPAIVKN